MERKKSKIVVVLGMHRSGTSAITRGLQVMGVSLGDTFVSPIEGNNVTGFWEDADLNALNNEMLDALGSDWYYLSPIETGNVDFLLDCGYLQRAADLLTQKTDSMHVFGFKDPRIAKLLPFWKKVFVYCQFDVSYVIAIRNPLSVAKSLFMRDGLEAERSHLLWLGYIIQSLAGAANYPCVLVDYDNLMQAPDHELTRIAKNINLTIDTTELHIYKTEFLDLGLQHTVYNLNDLSVDDTCPVAVREIYTALRDVANDNIHFCDPEFQSSIVNWISVFERLKPLLNLIDRIYSENVTAIKAASEHEGTISDLYQHVEKQDDQIGSLYQDITERDAHIVRLNQTIAERDGHIASLNKAIAKRDWKTAGLEELLIERDKTQKEILTSISWRLTAPLRVIGMTAGTIINVPQILFSAIKEGGGIRLTTMKAARVLKNEGLIGVRGILNDLRAPETRREIEIVPSTYELDSCKSTIPRIVFDKTYNHFVEYRNNPPINPLVKLIAFYLPQFHPFTENDEWWGKGFTEWTNVGKALPNYVGHYQPHCPIHVGYYDLRVPEVMEEQAKLAKEYGIYGFSYYFYWFDGKILLDTPLELMLSNKNVGMPFCLTWANENWSRRWDGQENDILIAQNHSDEDSLAFIRHLLKYFKDERYIRVEGKPVLVIYRADIIPSISATASIWRNELLKHGIPGLYLISAQSFGIRSPEVFDFDASVEFPPHTIQSAEISNQVQLTNANFDGKIYSYDQVVDNAILSREPDYKLYRTAMLSWDNTARKQDNSHIFHGFSILKYKQWLSSIVNKVYSNPKYSADEKIVFVNAWNEWAEGTHLEPDQKYGYGYLQSTYDVLKDYESLNLAKPNSIQATTKHSQYAVILHIHYDELWPNIRDYLLRLAGDQDQGFDLYVTVTSSSVATKVRMDFPDAYVMLVENRGRDILPFIRILKFIDNLDYTAVCKLHSKRSIYRNDGDHIRDEIFDALVGSKEQVDIILSRFKSNPRLGLVAPKHYLIEHNEHNMTFDKDVVDRVSKHIHIKFQYDTFPAGSMFWFFPKSLDSLLTMDDSFFDVESGLADGTCAHAVERMFCIIAKSHNYTIESC